MSVQERRMKIGMAGMRGSIEVNDSFFTDLFKVNIEKCEERLLKENGGS